MLTQKIVVDLIEILNGGFIQVREANIIEKNGIEIAKIFHRYILNPGDDVSGKEKKIQDIAAAVWTPEVIASYQASLQNNQNNIIE